MQHLSLTPSFSKNGRNTRSLMRCFHAFSALTNKIVLLILMSLFLFPNVANATPSTIQVCIQVLNDNDANNDEGGGWLFQVGGGVGNTSLTPGEGTRIIATEGGTLGQNGPQECFSAPLSFLPDSTAANVRLTFPDFEWSEFATGFPEITIVNAADDSVIAGPTITQELEVDFADIDSSVVALQANVRVGERRLITYCKVLLDNGDNLNTPDPNDQHPQGGIHRISSNTAGGVVGVGGNITVFEGDPKTCAGPQLLPFSVGQISIAETSPVINETLTGVGPAGFIEEDPVAGFGAGFPIVDLVGFSVDPIDASVSNPNGTTFQLNANTPSVIRNINFNTNRTQSIASPVRITD